MARQTQAQMKRFDDALNESAQRNGMSPDAVAMMYISDNKLPVKQWLKAHGINGSDNPAKLATQVLMQHEENVSDYNGSQYDGMPYDQAEANYFDEVERRADLGLNDFPDGFAFGPILNVAKKIGGKVVQKINEKRAKKGKKAILPKFQENNTGITPTNINTAKAEPRPVIDAIKMVMPSVDDIAVKLDRQIAENREAAAKLGSSTGSTSGGKSGGGGFFQDAKEIAEDVIDDVRKKETKKAITKYLPYIIAGVVLIVVIAFFAGRKK